MKPKQKELNPYLGPRPFERTDEDSKRFFGRDRETDEIVSLIFSHPLLLVYAQSGAGKTSLLNAGIAPALEKRDFNVFPIVRVGGAIPEQVNIDDISNVYVFNALMSLEPESPPKRLIDKTLTAFLKAIPRVASASGRLSPRALIFDQFEEIFTLYQKDWQDQQRAFFIQVSDALNDDPLLRVIFVIREEYLAQLDPFTRLLPEKLKTRFRLERLQEEAALQAIKEPVRDTGRHFAKGVAEQLVSDLLKVPIETPARVTVEIMGKFVEPVQLQMVCDRIWRNLKPGDQVISHELLRETGDVNRTLSEFYESSLKEAIQATGIGEDTLRKWFEQTLITPSGTRGTAFKGLTETGGIPNEIVEFLEKARLIRLEVRAGSPWCELSHDRFIVPIQKSNERWKKKQHELDEYSYMVQFYKANGNYGEALRVLQKALEIEPTQQAYTELGEIHRLNGDHDLAIENLKIAMDLNPVHERAHRELGITYRQKGEYENAVASLQKALEIEPTGSGYAELGETYRLKGDYDHAIENLKEAVGLETGYEWAYRVLGMTYRQKGEYDRAVTSLQKAIELEPTQWGYAELGETCRLKGDYTGAVDNLLLSIDLDPRYEWAHRILGITYRDKGEPGNAILSLQKALDIQPTQYSYAVLGEVYRSKGDSILAIEYLQKAVEIDPDYEWAYRIIGNTYKDTGEYDNAILSYQRALDLEPTHWVYAALGETYRLKKEYDRALEYLKIALDLDPGYEWAHRVSGITYREKGEYDTAIESLQKALEIDPTQWAYAALGETYRLKGEYDRAVESLTKAIDLDPGYEWAHRVLGITHKQKGEYDPAILSLQRAREIEPTKWTYAELGEIYRLKGDFDRAIANLKEAVDMDPRYEWAHRVLGMTYKQKGEYDQAIPGLEKARDIEPTQWVYAELGETYRLKGDHDRAIENLRKAVELDPGYEWAHRVLGITYREKGEYDAAVQSLQKALDIDPNHFSYAESAETYRLKEEYENALDHVNRAIKLDPGYVYSYAVLGEIFFNKNEYKAAIREFERAMKIDPGYQYAFDRCAHIYNEYLFDYLAAYKIYKELLELDKDHLEYKTNLVEASLTTRRFGEAHDMANEILLHHDSRQNVRIDIQLSMRLIVIASLVLQKKKKHAYRELGEFIRYYKSIPADYTRGWVYAGMKNFIQKETMTEDSRNLILKLIDLLEAPKSDARIREFEKSL